MATSSYKEAHEAFVSGLSGTTLYEVMLVALVVPVSS
jgi:hypothetical protein